jgi:hypothetical protein
MVLSQYISIISIMLLFDLCSGISSSNANIASKSFYNRILTMPFDELAYNIGGSGKAKVIWDNIRIGCDPLLSNVSMKCSACRCLNFLILD